MDESADVTEHLPNKNFHLDELEFVEGQEANAVPTPDSIPSGIQRGKIPLELQRSATVEALIAQNEDLMARLKVNLRRLTQSENEIDDLRIENRRLTDTAQALSLESQVFSEKELAWTAQTRRLEEQLSQAQSKIVHIQPLQEKVERYRKYHERIKTQVKPFIQQLKGYAESLTQEIQKLYAELAERDHELDQSRKAKARLEEQMQELLRRKEDQQALVVEQFERERELLLQEAKTLRARNAELELLTQHVDRMRVREDELENVIVSLKRDKELQFKLQQEKEQSLLGEVGQLRGQTRSQQHQIEELQKKNEGFDQERTRLQHQNVQLQEQIASLRYMWTQQSGEMEKQQAALASLEKLNAELSRQLNAFRQSGEPIRP